MNLAERVALALAKQNNDSDYIMYKKMKRFSEKLLSMQLELELKKKKGDFYGSKRRRADH